MSNALTDLMATQILPEALAVLRGATVMPALVNRDFSDQAAEKNSVIRVPLPSDLGVAGDFSGTTTDTDLAPGKVDVTLSEHKYKSFQMSTTEMMQSIEGGVLPAAADAAVKSVAQAINLSLLNLYKDIPFFTGSAGTPPSTAAEILAARGILQSNLAPPDNRYGVVSVDAEEKFLALWDNVSEVGDTEALLSASMGRKYGLDLYADQQTPEHEQGTLLAGTAIAAKGVTAIGATQVVLDDSGGVSLDGTLVAGDLITFDTSTTQHVITELATAVGDEITASIYPALDVATVDGTVVTLVDSHTPNLIFHRDAFCLAMRPLVAETDGSESSTISSLTDPVSGLSLRMETWRDSGADTRRWRVDALYGAKTLRQELAVRLLG